MMLRISQSTHAMSATAMTTNPRQNARDAAGLLGVRYRRASGIRVVRDAATAVRRLIGVLGSR